MEWHHVTSPMKKKLRSMLSAGKVLASAIWNEKGITLVNFLCGGTAVISDYYSQMPRKMSECSLNCVEFVQTPTLLPQPKSCLHENASPYTSVFATEAMTKFGCTVFLHSTYSPDIKPSGFHLFDPLKTECYCARAPLYADGQQLFMSRNTCPCSKVEEDC